MRAPLVERPLARVPDVDIEPPAMRARREAAIALATMPDDPWTFAQSLAASAPTPSPAADRLRCGDNERPRYADPEMRDGALAMDETAAAGPHYLAAQARLDARLRASADPFDHAVADALDVGQMRTPAGRVDALVQQATTTSDAKVYALAYRTCLVGRPTTAGCAALNARRWAELDPGNGIPWVYVFDQARNADDLAGQQAALAQLASASRFDDRRFAAAAAVAAHASDDDRDLAAIADLALAAAGMTLAEMSPISSLLAACRANAGGDAQQARQCLAVSALMFDHTDSVYVRAMGGALQFQVSGDATRRETSRAERALASATWSPATGFSACQEVRDTLKTLRRNGEVGEVEAARERARVFVTP